MKIGIVLSYISKNPAGLERYSYELVRHLLLADQENDYHLYVKRGTDVRILQPLLNPRTTIVPVKGGKLWKDLGLWLAPRADLYLFTGPIGPLFFSPQQTISIVYDFAYKYLAANWKEKLKNFLLDLYSTRTFAVSKRIICISWETQTDLHKFFPATVSKSVIIYPGFNNICLLPPIPVPLPAGNFFLFVGTIKERKNVLTIIKAFAIFCKKIAEPHNWHLVLAGKCDRASSYYRQLVQVIEEEKLTSQIHFIGHITDQELSFLYARAFALIYPSLLEGFGFPILEAGSCSLPVITSNLSSLREVAADGALLVDPYDPEDIAEAMEKIAINTALRNDLIEKNMARSRQFSWAKTAREFLKLIKQCSNQ